jgi:hypothetical protein
VPSHKWLDTGYSSQTLGLIAGWFHVRFVVEEEAVEQYLWFSLLFGLITIPPAPRAQLSSPPLLAIVLTTPHIITFSVFNLGPSCLTQNFGSYRASNWLHMLKRS